MGWVNAGIQPAAVGQLLTQVDLYRTRVDDQPLALTGTRCLDAIFNAQGVPADFSILMLNVFGMEYYLWESLQHYQPKLVLAQFNPTIPNDVKYVQPKDFALHQGCSLRALCDLAHYKGYELVAVTLEAAFFARRDCIYRIFEGAGYRYTDLEDMFAPVKMSWFQLYDGTLASGGLNRLMWHGLRIDEEKMQVVPKALRQFHQFAGTDYKKHFYRI